MSTAGRGAGPGLARGGDVILCADDFALSDGVSRGIEELALAGRLSATSAIVTLPGWEAHGRRLALLRPHLAIGLHLNLTLGAPAGPTASLAPGGIFPRHSELLRACLTGRIDTDEVAAEIGRQLDRFEAGSGFAPDYLDGHQHVHALPAIRRALLDVLARRYPQGGFMVRDPGDSMAAILARGAAAPKALVIAILVAGFGRSMRAAGFLTNRGFSGVSAFDERKPFAAELARFFSKPGPCHLVMCHPGYPDDELARLDPVVTRRRQELEAIMSAPGLDAAIWHVRREAGSDRVVWPGNEAAQ